MNIRGRFSIVSTPSSIHETVSIWNYSHIREGVRIGENTSVGDYVYIDKDVEIGANCKIQNSCLIYSPAKIHYGVFLGPGVVLTNDKYPRAISSNLNLKTFGEWNKQGVEVREGASIGAGAICIAPVTVGSWALVAAGAVVTKTVPSFALVSGNPAKFICWVGKSGYKLLSLGNGFFECPETGERYLEISSTELVSL